MNLRTIPSAIVRSVRGPSETPHRPPVAPRRPALYLAVAAAGAVMVNVLITHEPAAEAAPLESVSIAAELGISAQEPASLAAEEDLAPLEQLAASRSERDADRTAAAQAQTAAQEAELAARAAAEEQAAAARPGQGTDAPVAPKGSYKEYAMGKLGGAGSEFSCLENLWGKESGWNPNAQNPSSTAYGIAQFLNSTWAGTGIAKTSDPYRQIDAGLVYIQKRYGTPCKAWAYWQSHRWY